MIAEFLHSTIASKHSVVKVLFSIASFITLSVAVIMFRIFSSLVNSFMAFSFLPVMPIGQQSHCYATALQFIPAAFFNGVIR